ncbi:MAG TPA: cation diffusion facilitator family transporter [Thermoanaerobaculia bacterium]|nr:cation diffusion facilitator family transporter [Thermoanaerobaculia bacterium]
MSHHHHHASGSAASQKLLIASIATAAFVVVEIVVGIRANSLALIGDALHNVTDTLALLLALFAVRVERRPATSAKSYGWHRAGVLAAFINAGALAAFTIFLFVEAAQRLRAPANVNSTAMLVTAAGALVLNGAITLWLRREGRHDLNIRGAVLHMLGDAISSAGIIAAALLIRRTGALFWDPAVSIAIGVLILWSSWGILREAINLLLEGTPEGIDPEAVTRAIAELEGVDGVHHLHIWALGASRPALSCHLMVGDIPVRSTGNLLARINAMLDREYGIAHTTIQFEFASCDVDDPYCVPYGENAKSDA